MFNDANLQPAQATMAPHFPRRGGTTSMLSMHLEAAEVRPLRGLASKPAMQRCPACGSIVYSRRHRLCGVCFQPLPEECLFTIAEARRIAGLIETERQRHRKWLAGTFAF